jgi:hypothetical protein
LKGRIVVVASALLLFASCRPGRMVLAPIPDRIESVQGHASIRTNRSGASARARLAFRLVPPLLARLEALDPLNRTIFTVLVDGEEAVLVVPSRKAYWEGPRTDVLDAGLGFPLSVVEMAGLLTGRGPAASEADGTDAAWTLTRDGQGRIVSGSRQGFSFGVDEFFSRAGAPRRIRFAAADVSGALTVLGLTFNAAVPEAAASLRIPPAYARLTKAEMTRLLRDED